jgi:hypothetical protein
MKTPNTPSETSKKNWFQKHKIWTGFIGLFLFVSIANSISRGEKGMDDPSIQLPTKDAISEDNKSSSEVAKSLTKLDSLWIALDQSVGKDKFDLQFDEESGLVTLTKGVDDYWDTYDIVSRSYSNFVKFGLKAFEIDGVKKLKLISKAGVTDKYGKKSEEDGVILTMTKEQFTKFDWPNMKGKAIYSATYIPDFDEVFLYPAILKVVIQNPSKIKLTY